MGLNAVRKKGRLYVLEMWIDNLAKPVYKIGVTYKKNATDRLLEIVGSYFKKYRVTPVVKIKRDREIVNAFAKEAELHRYFSEYRYVPKHKFSGSTEIFDVDMEVVVQKYEEVYQKSKSVKGKKATTEEATE